MPSIPSSQHCLPQKSIHRLAGTIRAVFADLQWLNQLTRLFGAKTQLAYMETLRPYNRHWLSETVLLLAVAVQLLSGFGQLDSFLF